MEQAAELAYTAFNTRGNRGQSQYNSLTLGIDARRVAQTGLQVSAKYTISDAKDNLSSTFSDSAANYNLGYLDAFDPMLDYGNAEFDVRHRFAMSAIWNLPFFVNSTGVTRTLLGGWQVNWIFAARTGFPFTLWDCTSGVVLLHESDRPGRHQHERERHHGRALTAAEGPETATAFSDRPGDGEYVFVYRKPR